MTQAAVPDETTHIMPMSGGPARATAYLLGVTDEHSRWLDLVSEMQPLGYIWSFLTSTPARKQN